MRADIAGYSPEGALVLLVEVKSVRAPDGDWAARYARNLFVHMGLPGHVFFLLVTSNTMFLWRPPLPPTPRDADYLFPTPDLLDPYFRFSSSSAASSTGYGLELATMSWLTDLTTSQLPADQTLAARLRDTGLAAALEGGSIRAEVDS